MSPPPPPLPRPKRRKIWVDYLVQFRWLIIVFIALPISSLLHLASYLSALHAALKPPERRRRDHDASVREIVSRLRRRDPSKHGLVCSARKPYAVVGMRNVDYKRARRYEVDLSRLRHILDIDPARMVARVEPLVSMGQLTCATVPLGLSVPVVSELDDLTVGGLVNGYGIEGSSHIYGLFSDTLVSLELVLADGRLVRATAENEYADLFHAVPWSQGTLGFLVAAEIKLIKIDKYMRLTYTPVCGTLREMAQMYADTFAPRDGDPSEVPDFVESLIYSPTEGVFMTGRYAEEAGREEGSRINRIGWWFKPWFYQHAATALKRGEFVEYIPTREYYHRHTRSLFWEMKLILPFADQWWFRWLLGWAMPPKISLMKITQGEAIRKYYHDMHVIQDMLLPLYKVADALEFLHQEMEVYPIWLCPHRVFKLPMKAMVSPEAGYEEHGRQGDTGFAQMFTDIGVYYAPGPVLRGEEFDGSEAVRRLEEWLIQNHGFQPQYSVTEMTERSFWRMFDGRLYEECRRKYRAVGTFMDVYYKSKKGKKTEREVKEAEAAVAEVESREKDE